MENKVLRIMRIVLNVLAEYRLIRVHSISGPDKDTWYIEKK